MRDPLGRDAQRIARVPLVNQAIRSDRFLAFGEVNRERFFFSLRHLAHLPLSATPPAPDCAARVLARF